MKKTIFTILLSLISSSAIADNSDIKQISCDQYHQRIAEYLNIDRSIEVQKLALNRKENEAAWLSLNAQRSANMLLMSHYNLEARPPGCSYAIAVSNGQP